MSWQKMNPLCLGATLVVGFLVIFFGVWAGEEAFYSNHKVDSATVKHNPTDHTECNQGLPEHLHSSPQRSLVSRLLSRVGLSRRLCAKEDTLLRNKPFVLSHDAATGYDGGGTPFLKTQNMGFTGQLNCGARALDLRLGYKTSEEQDKRELKFHHGVYMSQQTVAKEIGGEVMEWAKKNPDELVILLLSHCKVGGGPTDGGGDCDAPFFEPFKTLGIKVVENAEELKKMTVKQAEELAQIGGARQCPSGYSCQDQEANDPQCKEKGSKSCCKPSGRKLSFERMLLADLEIGATCDRPSGKILAIYAKEDNVQSMYDEKIQFGGTIDDVNTNSCLTNCATDAWARLWEYCNSKLDATHDMMWQLQAIWQKAQWPVGETVDTGINKAIAERIFSPDKETQDKWNKLNFLLLNVVECEGAKIGEKFGAKSKDQCSDPDYC